MVVEGIECIRMPEVDKTADEVGGELSSEPGLLLAGWFWGVMRDF